MHFPDGSDTSTLKQANLPARRVGSRWHRIGPTGFTEVNDSNLAHCWVRRNRGLGDAQQHIFGACL
jgi:hypothetical protein